jgi:hypothetical protein
MTDELENICNKVAVACFEVLSPHLSEGTEEGHENPQSRQLFCRRKFKLGNFE